MQPALDLQRLFGASARHACHTAGGKPGPASLEKFSSSTSCAEADFRFLPFADVEGVLVLPRTALSHLLSF